MPVEKLMHYSTARRKAALLNSALTLITVADPDGKRPWCSQLAARWIGRVGIGILQQRDLYKAVQIGFGRNYEAEAGAEIQAVSTGCGIRIQPGVAAFKLCIQLQQAGECGRISVMSALVQIQRIARTIIIARAHGRLQLPTGKPTPGRIFNIAMVVRA